MAAVIDTKTMFFDVEVYASKNALSLMNDHPERQLEFLGSGIKAIILAASSTVSATKLRKRGKMHGMHIFSLSRTKSEPVKLGADRRWETIPEITPDNEWPLALFFQTALEATEEHDRLRPEVF